MLERILLFPGALDYLSHLKAALPPARDRCCECDKKIPPGKPGRKCKLCRGKEDGNS